MLVGHVNRIGPGRQGQIDHGVGQVDIAFRHSQEVAGLVDGDRQSKGVIIGQSDVLGGKPDQPPGDVQGVFPGLQHPGQPVDSCIGIAVSHGFMEGGDQIIMLFTILII